MRTKFEAGAGHVPGSLSQNVSSARAEMIRLVGRVSVTKEEGTVIEDKLRCGGGGEQMMRMRCDGDRC